MVTCLRRAVIIPLIISSVIVALPIRNARGCNFPKLLTIQRGLGWAGGGGRRGGTNIALRAIARVRSRPTRVRCRDIPPWKIRVVLLDEPRRGARTVHQNRRPDARIPRRPHPIFSVASVYGRFISLHWIPIAREFNRLRVSRSRIAVPQLRQPSMRSPMRSDDTFVNWVPNKSAFLTLYISRHPPPLPVPLFISYLRDDARSAFIARGAKRTSLLKSCAAARVI